MTLVGFRGVIRGASSESDCIMGSAFAMAGDIEANDEEELIAFT
jgi:hypothetical protein